MTHRLVVDRRVQASPWVLRLFLVLAGISLLASTSYIAELKNPNENVRLYLTMAVVEDHALYLDGPLARYGYVNDMARPPAVNGVQHLYPAKPPGVSYLGVPVYWALRHIGPLFGLKPPDLHVTAAPPRTPEEAETWFRASLFALRFSVVAIPDFLFFVFFFRWLRRWTDDDVLRIALTAAALLGTNYLAYSQELVSHAMGAAAGFTAFALTAEELAWSPAARRVGRAFAIGLLAGMPVLLEYTGGTLTLALGSFALLVLWRPRTLVPFALGAAVDAVLLLSYNWKCFGGPFVPPHKFLENQAFASFHTRGVFGVGFPDPHVLGEISFTPSYGIFATTPALLAALLCIPFGLFVVSGTAVVRKHVRKTAAACLVMIAVLFATVGGITYWHGGWSIGPRFLGAAPPFLAFAALLGLEELARFRPGLRALARTVAAGLAPVGVVILGLTGLVSATLPEEITRPFTQFTVPMLRAGMAPWLATGLVGLTSYRIFWGIAAALVLAPLLALAVPAGDSWKVHLGRVAFGAALFVVGLRFNVLAPDLPPTAGQGPTAWLSTIWEPRGTSRLAEQLTRAERMSPSSPATACAWAKVATSYWTLHRDDEAKRAEAKAAGASTSCY